MLQCAPPQRAVRLARRHHTATPRILQLRPCLPTAFPECCTPWRTPCPVPFKSRCPPRGARVRTGGGGLHSPATGGVALASPCSLMHLAFRPEHIWYLAGPPPHPGVHAHDATVLETVSARGTALRPRRRQACRWSNQSAVQELVARSWTSGAIPPERSPGMARPSHMPDRAPPCAATQTCRAAPTRPGDGSRPRPSCLTAQSPRPWRPRSSNAHHAQLPTSSSNLLTT